MIKAWLLEEEFRAGHWDLHAEGAHGEWGAGDSVAEEEDLPPAPAGLTAKPATGESRSHGSLFQMPCTTTSTFRRPKASRSSFQN